MDPSGKPLHTLTAAELRACAVEYRKMAARATAAGAAESLYKLAEQYEAMATKLETPKA
jgi:hypothetical protein